MKMMSFSIGRIVLVLLAIWLVVIILLSGPLFHNTEPDEQLLARLTRAVGELEALKQQNEELHALLTSLKSPVIDGKNKETVKTLQNVLKQYDSNGLQSKSFNACKVPSVDAEETRRRVERGVQEWWYYMRSELRKLNNSIGEKLGPAQVVTNILEDATDYHRTILWDLKRLAELEGITEWRSREAKELASLIQHRIAALQNPKDCGSAKKLVCNLNKGCGFGCQLHHVTYCLIVAYGTKRTLVLHSRNWRYSKEGWEAMFLPLSLTCLDDSGKTRDSWPGTDDIQVLDLPIVDNVKPKPPYLPLDIPKDIADRLTRFHGNPGAWWIGQFVYYLCRPQPHLLKMFEEAESSSNFKKPIVGVHVRRTDKIGTEASYHDLSEYMNFVDLYYKSLALKQTVEVRRVYLATDDPGLLAEAKRRYPDYKFLGDVDVAKSASMSSRYSTSSLRGVVLDINMLAKCDYLVCTFSSQVCRVAYEVMQTLHPDASGNVQSLDDIFYFGGQKDHNQVALYDHLARHPGEIDLKRGDVVGIAGNHWDGFSKGVNRRTHKSGLYPSYKVREKIDAVEFASYAEIDKSWKPPT